MEDGKVYVNFGLSFDYHPGENAYFNSAAISRTLVYKLTVEEMTGKKGLFKRQ